MTTPDHSSTQPKRGAFVYTIHYEGTSKQAAAFAEIQRRFEEAAQGFPGFLGQDTSSTPTSAGVAYTTQLQFDSLSSCLKWLDSDTRRQLLVTAEKQGYSYRGSMQKPAFEQWLSSRLTTKPPVWKINLLVLLALYPSVMLLQLVASPLLEPLSKPSAVLIGNAITVAMTGWLLVPTLSRTFQRWLEGRGSAAYRALCLAAILGALAGLYLLFEVID
ncbi:MAG: hypothetical protein AAF799_29880 [Myxococcota bacterium]